MRYRIIETWVIDADSKQEAIHKMLDIEGSNEPYKHNVEVREKFKGRVKN